MSKEESINMERTIVPGQFYKHFKNKLYQIITVAKHSETEEELVIYQALYGDFNTYARPLSMFLSEVDRQKYPDVLQHYRFEQVQMITTIENNQDKIQEKLEDEVIHESVPHPVLLDFLEANTLEAKLHCLHQLKTSGSQKELDSIYVVLDMAPLVGDYIQQIDGIQSYLQLQDRYDGTHLR